MDSTFYYGGTGGGGGGVLAPSDPMSTTVIVIVIIQPAAMGTIRDLHILVESFADFIWFFHSQIFWKSAKIQNHHKIEYRLGMDKEMKGGRLDFEGCKLIAFYVSALYIKESCIRFFSLNIWLFQTSDYSSILQVQNHFSNHIFFCLSGIWSV